MTPRRPGCLRAPLAAARRAARRPTAPSPRSIVAGRGPGPEGRPVRVDSDEHPRADTTLEALAKLKPIVRPGGTVTAGNASGVNDGAAAMILASAEAAEQARADAASRASSAWRSPACRRASWASARCRRSTSSSSGSGVKVADFDVDRAERGLRQPGAGLPARNSALPTTPSTSTRTAARSRSAIRSACPAPGSPATRAASSTAAAAATRSRRCASASGRAWRWRSSAPEPGAPSWIFGGLAQVRPEEHPGCRARGAGAPQVLLDCLRVHGGAGRLL